MEIDEQDKIKTNHIEYKNKPMYILYLRKLIPKKYSLKIPQRKIKERVVKKKIN